jgi:EAL domain-containing protein (putative c-di-GMP-specific phosphodiesterase class I)/DNA-binding NarL/FixJ family response regulator
MLLGHEGMSHGEEFRRMEQASAHADAGSRRIRPPIRVIVADDEELIVDVLRSLVGSDPSLRFVGAANDAEHAIDLVLEEQPDVVLLDVRMPGGGGVRATRQITERSPRTKIIGLSAHQDADTVIRMIAAGAHGYVPKGDPTDKILRTIHRVTSGRRPSSVGKPDLMLVPSDTPRRDDRAGNVARAILDGAVTVELLTIVDIETMQPVGLEAKPRLATLPHRSYDAWCADARSVGLLTDLEITAFREARLALREVPEDMFLEIEVSPFTASEPRFRRSIQGTSSSRIVLAFSPVAASGDVRIDDVDFADTLAALRTRGIRVAAIDTGTGMSGLHHLPSLMPDFVRLDTTLTRSIDSSFSSHSVVAAVVACARQVGAEVIAGGVDSEEQLDAIRSLGVRFAQGPLFGEPVPISEVSECITMGNVRGSSSPVTQPIRSVEVVPSHTPTPRGGIR